MMWWKCNDPLHFVRFSTYASHPRLGLINAWIQQTVSILCISSGHSRRCSCDVQKTNKYLLLSRNVHKVDEENEERRGQNSGNWRFGRSSFLTLAHAMLSNIAFRGNLCSAWTNSNITTKLFIANFQLFAECFIKIWTSNLRSRFVKSMSISKQARKKTSSYYDNLFVNNSTSWDPTKIKKEKILYEDKFGMILGLMIYLTVCLSVLRNSITWNKTSSVTNWAN